MLEYIYTNRVKDMPGLSADEVIKLLALANGGFCLPISRVGCPSSTVQLVGSDKCLLRVASVDACNKLTLPTTVCIAPALLSVPCQNSCSKT